MRWTNFVAALLAAGQAHAFCDEGILQTDVLCLTGEVEEIKVCRTLHPETGRNVLTLHLDPAVSEGPMFSVVEEIPFSMTLGTGGFPWDTYGLTFSHEGGRATLALRRGMDATDNEGVEISLALFGRGAEPHRTLTCLVPALRAEVETLLAARGIEPNAFRTGPSAESLPFYTPRMPLPGDTPYGGHSCREVGLTVSNEGTDSGQVALYTAPFQEAAVSCAAQPKRSRPCRASKTWRLPSPNRQEVPDRGGAGPSAPSPCAGNSRPDISACTGKS